MDEQFQSDYIYNDEICSDLRFLRVKLPPLPQVAANNK